jgi:serine/threonine protein kinase
VEKEPAGFKPQAIVNDCYILQHRIKEDAFAEYWHATAIFSAQGFLLRFLNSESLPPKILEAFYAQALASIDLRHSSLLPSLEIERFGERLYLAGDASSLKCLSDLVEEGQKFPLLHVCLIGLELAQGLQIWEERAGPYLLVHPDVVWVRMQLGKAQEIRLLNPGYATMISSRPGTEFDKYRAFLAPEVRLGHAQDFRSDLWSLGALLFWLLTGETLSFQAGGAKASPSLLYVAYTLKTRRVPKEMILIVLTMLRAAPENRYGSWSTLIDELSAVVKALQAQSPGLIDPLAVRAGFVSSFSSVETAPLSGQTDNFPQILEPHTWEETLSRFYGPDNPSFSPSQLLDFTQKSDFMAPGSRTQEEWRSLHSRISLPEPSPETPAPLQESPSITAFESPKPNVEPDTQQWHSETGSTQAVLERLAQDWRRAAVQQGTLRFIEEPHQRGPIQQFLNLLHEKSLYAELPEKLLTSGSPELLKFLESGWERRGTDRSATYLKRLRQRIRKVQKDKTGNSFEDALKFLEVLGTRATPLVLVLHHAQTLSRELHDLFMALRSHVQGASFCVFAFFEPVQVPEWHVLYQLTQNATPQASAAESQIQG